MSTKISGLPAAATLGGGEQVPAVQNGGNVRLTPLDIARMIAQIPEGMGAFRVLKFGGCTLDPNNNETINLETNSANSSAIAFAIPNGSGGMSVLGFVGARQDSGGFVGCADYAQSFTIENCAGLNLNWRQLFDSYGTLLCVDGTPLLQGIDGPIPAIADATDTGDMLNKFNTLLAGLRMLGLLASE